MAEVPIETPAEIAKNTNLKINTLFGLAALVVIACLAVVIFLTEINEFAKGIITLILGRFLGYLDNLYSYETGTTRGSAKKDDTIKEFVAVAKAKKDAVV